MAAKINSVIVGIERALYLWAVFFLGGVEIRQVNGVPNNVSKNDHNTFVLVRE